VKSTFRRGFEQRAYHAVNAAMGQAAKTSSHPSCAFCRRPVRTHRHHLTPRSKGGTGLPTAAACSTCESFIHKTWSHNELRTSFCTVEAICQDKRFCRYLHWLQRQQPSAVFPSRRNKNRGREKFGAG
jgi:hypothetical protein